MEILSATKHITFSFIRNWCLSNTTTLAITGVIKGTSRDRRYYELVFESLENRRWYAALKIKILSSSVKMSGRIVF